MQTSTYVYIRAHLAATVHHGLMDINMNSANAIISRATALGFLLSIHLLVSPCLASQCVKVDHTEMIRVESGKVYPAKVNKCVLLSSAHWVRSDVVQNSLDREPEFHYHRPNCCCRVEDFVPRTVSVDGTVIKFKQVQSCVCRSCCDLD